MWRAGWRARSPAHHNCERRSAGGAARRRSSPLPPSCLPALRSDPPGLSSLSLCFKTRKPHDIVDCPAALKQCTKQVALPAGPEVRTLHLRPPCGVAQSQHSLP